MEEATKIIVDACHAQEMLVIEHHSSTASRQFFTNMIIEKTEKKLETRESLTIKVLKSPLEEYVDKLENYTQDKMPWAEDNKKRFKGELVGECKDLYFIGEIENEIVSLMWYTVSGDAGSYGMVSTKEEHRRKGISACLMERCLKFMDKEKGLLAMYLGVTNPIARKMYEKYGWVAYNDCPNTCIMRRLKDPNISQDDFDNEYYKYCGKAKVKDAKRGDLPKFESLYNWAGNEWFIKDYSQNIFKDTAVESQIIALNNLVDNSQGFFCCLENPKNRIVGSATLISPSSVYQRHNKILDFFIHPNYQNQGEELLDFILKKKKGEEIVWFYSASSDKEKVNLAKKLGFKKKAV